MAEQSQTMTQDRGRSHLKNPHQLQGLQEVLPSAPFAASGGSGRAESIICLVERMRYRWFACSADRCRHQGESSLARKEVYWVGEHSSRECLLGAQPEDLAFCLLGWFHLSQETSYQMGAAFRHPRLVSPEA